MKRQHPQHTITNYIEVPSVTEYMARVEQLGGKICRSKMAASQVGYFAIYLDTENNVFGIWETDENAA